MTKEMVMKMIKGLGEDVSVDCYEDKIKVKIHDFLGFDEKWSEIYSDKLDNDKIKAFEDTLKKECVGYKKGCYSPDVYTLEEFSVEISYSSVVGFSVKVSYSPEEWDEWDDGM